MPLQRSPKQRRGSFVLEVVVAAALFGTAAIALARLSQASSALSIKGDQRLSAQLTAQNVIDALHRVEFDSIESESEAIADSAAEESNWIVKVESDDFQAVDQDAIHLAVTISEPKTKNRIIQLHDWRVRKLAESTKKGDRE